MAKIVFSTGAGISVPSGIPPYRGTGGIYTDNPELEQALTANNMFYARSQVLNAIEKMKSIVDACKPNAAHVAIAELEQYHDVTVITQNVDNFHLLAGSSKVLELHGNLYRERIDEIDEDEMRPDVVLFGELLPEDIFHEAVLAVENADVVVAVGTSATVYPAASLLDIANDRAYLEGPKFKFYYLSLDAPEAYFGFAKIQLGSADVLVPDMCEYLKNAF
jgi:NAD-dependent deacetylase